MSWATLPAKLKTYIILLALAAVPTVLFAVRSVHSKPPEDFGWVILTGLAVVTVPFFVLLPSVKATIEIADSYIMAIGMMYGTAPCVIATLCQTTVASLFAQKRPRVPHYQTAFNASSMVCGAWIYSNVYHLLNPNNSTELQYIILPAAALTATFFLVNSLLTATAIAWSTNESILSFWLKNCLPLAIDFSVSSVSATFIVSLSHFNRYIPLAAAPLVLVVWGWSRVNKSRVMEAENHLKEQEQLYLRTVESLALAVDAKDQTTYGHIRRVRAFAMGLAKLCDISDPDELKAIETGSLLHDIGKLAIEDYILNKPGRLSRQEFDKMKLHAEAGDQILQQVRFPFPVARLVRSHHERWDGLGYPDGLKGDEIPLGARILAISDAFDAIRSSRPYKQPYGLGDSVELLRAQGGTVYDPHLVELFINHINALDAAAEAAAKNAPELSFRKYYEKVDRAVSAADPVNYLPTTVYTPSDEPIEILEFCSSIGRHMDLDDFLQILARRLPRILPHATCVVFMDNGEGNLEAAHASGKYSELLKNAKVEIGKGISGWVAAYRRPMINSSPKLEFQDLGRDLSALLDSLVVPLLSDGECFGTISLYAEKPDMFTESHLKSLQNLASIATPYIAEIRSMRRSTQGIHGTDPVTQTHRITYLSVAASELISIADKNKSELSLLCIDINGYSQLVNLYGTHCGDAVLRKVADIIKSELRDTDVLVRYGRQGFAALLAGVRKEKAARCAQRLRHQIRSDPMSDIVGHSIPVDCRAGVATYPVDGTSIFALLQTAQQSMLDRVRAAGQSAEEPNIIEFPPRA